MPPAQSINLHATAIAVDGAAILLTGRSGSGKSDLALRCISLAEGPIVPSPPRLIADDRVVLTAIGDALEAGCPQPLSGLLEVRGVGIVRVPDPLASARVRLVVELVEGSDIERQPETLAPVEFCGIPIPRWRIYPFEPSAPIKLLLALRAVQN